MDAPPDAITDPAVDDLPIDLTADDVVVGDIITPDTAVDAVSEDNGGITSGGCGCLLVE